LHGELTNSGLITADQSVVVTAENLYNLKGSIEGRDVRLYADIDINNTGGRIAANDRLKLQAGRDLNVQSTTQTTETVAARAEYARLRALSLLPRAEFQARAKVHHDQSPAYLHNTAYNWNYAAKRVVEERKIEVRNAQIKEAIARKDWLAVIHLASGSDMGDMWAAAMTAHHGPTGIHTSWTTALGTPSKRLLAASPSVAWRIERAVERLALYASRL
jgi:adhesin HecA-like repeat protein